MFLTLPPVAAFAQQPQPCAFRRWAFERVGIRPSDQHDAAVWNLAGPAVLALAADPLLGVVDTAFVGRLGPEALVRQRLRLRFRSMPSAQAAPAPAFTRSALLTVCNLLR